MRTEVRNQITMLGNPVAVEIASPRDGHRRWLRLAPHDGQIAWLEVEVPADVDPVAFPISDDDYVIVARASFDSLDAALVAVHNRGVDSDSLDAIWRSDNPF